MQSILLNSNSKKKLQLIIEFAEKLGIKAKLLSADEKEDFFDSLTEDQKEDIRIGVQEIENNETINYDEFMSKFRK